MKRKVTTLLFGMIVFLLYMGNKGTVLAEGKEFIKGDTILEADDVVYLCGAEEILRFDLKENTTEVLWESAADRRISECFMQGTALLWQDKIYFVEQRRENIGPPKEVLSTINPDGSGYRQLLQFEHSISHLVVADNILYAFSAYSNCEEQYAYRVNREGNLIPLRETEKEIFYGKMPEGYSEVKSRGGVLSLPECRENYGYYLMENAKGKLFRKELISGTETELFPEGYLTAMNQQFFLFVQWEEKTMHLYLVNSDTLEVKEVSQEWNRPDVIGMDGEFIYLKEDNYEKGTIAYGKIALQSGKSSRLFEQKTETWLVGGEGEVLGYLVPVTLLNGYLYYTEFQEHDIYLARRPLTNISKKEILGEPIYKSGIRQVGDVKYEHIEVYGKEYPEQIFNEANAVVLRVDSRFPGAGKINQTLQDYQKEIITYVKDETDIEWREEFLKEEEPDSGIPATFFYSYSTYPVSVTCLQNHYLSFCQDEYDYEGGAHGVPYWYPFTFDLISGEQLTLKDIIDNTEEELKTIVSEYFADYIAQSPEGFWNDAVDTVKRQTDMESNFFLKEDGICFYYGPYDISCYAAGMQAVTIPYSEFKMKIEVEEKE